MRCQQASELMSLRLDRPLTPEGERTLQEHLAGCPACRAEEVLLQRVNGLLGNAPLLAPPAGFVPDVMVLVRRRAARRSMWRGALALFLGALSLLALGTAPYLVLVLFTLVVADSPTAVSALVGVLRHTWGILQTVSSALGLLARALWTSPNWLILMAYVALAAALGAWWVRWAMRPLQQAHAKGAPNEKAGRELSP